MIKKQIMYEQVDGIRADFFRIRNYEPERQTITKVEITRMKRHMHCIQESNLIISPKGPPVMS